MSDKPKDQREVHPFSPGIRQGARTEAPVEIITGIDCGTRFTKVAVGGEGQEPLVWRGSSSGPLIPSIVHITAENDLLPWPDDAAGGATKIEYLKMLLAKPRDTIFDLPASILARTPRIAVVRALAALFLSEIIRRVRKSEQEKPHLRDANIRWLVHVGVPVEYYDADEREVFREVASVAFEWGKSPPSDFKFETVVRAYYTTLNCINPTDSPASVFPELAAALLEFIQNPNRPEGRYYGFCDIGGGTVDGAIFRLHREYRSRRDARLHTQSQRLLAIYSASVAPLGTAAVARAVVGNAGRNMPFEGDAALSSRIETLLTEKDEKDAPLETSQEPAAQFLNKHGAEAKISIQSFVRRFVNEARMKRNVDGYTFADPVSGKKIERRFYLAGGGAESGWYSAAILDLDPNKNLAFNGVERLRLETVKGPSGFRGGDFPRFVIALGLANSPEELEETSRLLPSKIERQPPLPEAEPVRPITKDDM